MNDQGASRKPPPRIQRDSRRKTAPRPPARGNRWLWPLVIGGAAGFALLCVVAIAFNWDADSAPPPPAVATQHVAGVWDGSQQRLFVDGTLQDAETIQRNLSGTP
jgi:hypothetical protein